MTSYRRRLWQALLLLAAIAVTLTMIASQLDPSAQDAIAGSLRERVLFRQMRLPDGFVLARRAPAESTAELSRLLGSSSANPELFALRAQERERLLDIAGAEADWKRAAEVAADKAQALDDLAGFYERRNEPEQELSTLLQVAKLPASGLDRFRREENQRSWHAFARAAEIGRSDHLAPEAIDNLYQSWIERYPKSSTPYTLYLDVLVADRNVAHAQALTTRMAAEFPDDLELQLQSQARVQSIEGGSKAELAVYDRRFDPLWPASLRTRYYELLKSSNSLRAFLSHARAASAAQPANLAPVLRISFYYEQSADRENADRALLEWESRRDGSHSALSPAEYQTLATVFARIGDYDESSRAWYSLYARNNASAQEREVALGNLISLLLDVPEQPLRLGQRDLSLYRNIAQMDRRPGFLNGILSLALNTTAPDFEYQNASQTAVGYFHRASAVRLIEVMQRDFPASKVAVGLQAKLFAAYAVYGQNEALIHSVPDWLKANPTAPEYLNTALLLADAYYSTNRSADEFRLYGQLLNDLAARSDHVPIGPEAASNTRSAAYPRVLDRYLSRLTELNRLTDALAVYKREIVHNPDDSGLYERLALFIEQNRLDQQLAETYREAFLRFKDVTWADKLARLYLRRKEYASYQSLVQQVGTAFQGAEFAQFVTLVSPDARVNPVLYRQINLYAHRRFPHNLVFVRNLLHAYQLKATADPVAYERLLRENWFYDPGLRAAFFEHLTRTGRLKEQLAALPVTDAAAKANNVAALEMRAEGSAWLTDFESSAPAFAHLAELAPGDRSANTRAISIERSLSYSQPNAFARAVAFAEQDQKAAPADRDTLTRVGEVYADRDQYRDAALWWNRIAGVHPGMSDGYLDAATVFWDYFRYDDALRIIRQARQAFHQPVLFAYEAGAIHENQNEMAAAADEYIRAALEEAPSGENALAEQRLITLASRKVTAGIIEERAASLAAGAFDLRAIELRIRILESANRPGDIHALLNASVGRAPTVSDADAIRASADHFGFDDTAVAALRRIVSLTVDPVEKMKAEVDLATFYESHRDLPAAERELSNLLQDNPAVIGVIRANVDFYWRQNRPAKAVQVLTAAASRAQQPYATQLLSEAAEKADQSGDYETARRLLDQLLVSDPFNSDLLARKAETYAQDPQALAAFYDQELKVIEASSLSANEKIEKTFALRRGYIPVLIAIVQLDPALDQYEQLLNRYPEDESLAREAARFAKAHQFASRLTAYYEKATTDSPRNYRWPLLLARIDRTLGRYEEALAAYDKAVYVRPDRADILQSKADLELRLGKFDAALKTNDKLYDLSYHNPGYLVAKASILVQQGKQADALELLRAAYIQPQPKEPAGYIEAMRHLLAWGMFEQANTLYAEARPLLVEHVDLAGEALTLDLQALSCLHKFDEAVAAFEWAARNVKDVAAPARAGGYLEAIGKGIREYTTPEEKEAIAARLLKPGALPGSLHLADLAAAAGLYDLAVKSLAKNPNRWSALQEMENSRLAFDELGKALENFSRKASAAGKRDSYLNAALQAYARTENRTAELRVMSALIADGAPVDTERFAQEFVAAHGNLASLLPGQPKYADAVVQYVLNAGSFDDLKRALQTRGAELSAPWTDSYYALASLYLAHYEPSVAAAFQTVLGPRTVEAELADLQRGNKGVLKGATWLYYGGRYGEYLGRNASTEAQELLPAPLESAPAASNSYLELAQTLRDMKQRGRALALYRAALELSPRRADVYDGMAQTAFESGDKEQARTDWHHALQLLISAADSVPLPADVVSNGQIVIAHLNHAGLAERLHNDVDTLIGTLVRRSGAETALPIFQTSITTASDPQQELARILKLASDVDLTPALNEMLTARWIPEAQKGAIYELLIEVAKRNTERVIGDARNAASEQLQEARANYVRYLLTQNGAAQAWNVLAAIEPDRRPADLTLSAAALSGHLSEQLDKWRKDSAKAPSADQLLSVAAQLKTQNQPELALQIREFEYQREMQNENPPASAYFGLADVRFDQGQNSEADDLIRGALMNTGLPFENLPEAVRLLQQHNRTPDALAYAKQWRDAMPWNAEARLTYARLAQNAGALEEIRSSNQYPYKARVDAAESLADLHQQSPGSNELALLTHQNFSDAEASRPFFVAARLRAAQTASPDAAQARLLTEAVRIDPSLAEPRLEIARIAFASGRVDFGLAALDSSTARSPSENSAGLSIAREAAARALVAQGKFGSAIAMCDVLLDSIGNSEKRGAIEQLRKEVAVNEKLASLNATRQPVIQEDLMQPLVVRPKLLSLPPGEEDQ